MKVKYFKNLHNSQDCYVGQKGNEEFDFFNIIYISKNYFGVFANEESSNYPDGRLDGFYRLMKADKRSFEKLKETAKEGNRKEGITLLKKIHEKNPDKNPRAAIMEGDLREFDFEIIHEMYMEAKPILK